MKYESSRLMALPNATLSVVYFPPWYCAEKCKALSNYIVQCVDKLSRKYADPCFLLVGDFNSLNCNLFNKYLRFKQLVVHSTRGENILDKIFTNRGQLFDVPTNLPLQVGLITVVFTLHKISVGDCQLVVKQYGTET